MTDPSSKIDITATFIIYASLDFADGTYIVLKYEDTTKKDDKTYLFYGKLYLKVKPYVILLKIILVINYDRSFYSCLCCLCIYFIKSA